MKYITAILLCLFVSCATTPTQQKTKTLNTLNLIKTNYGTYKLLSTEEQNIKNGLPLREHAKVKEIDLPMEEKKITLPPKQQQLANEMSLSTIKIGPPIEKSPHVEEIKSPIKVNWLNLVMFYVLSAWILFLSWITFDTLRKYRKKEEDPFKKENKINPPKP
jgi:hypothetical protein